MQTIRNVLVVTAMMLAAAFPAAAQQDSPPAPSEQHSVPQGAMDHDADQQAPGEAKGGMMKQGGMMNDGPKCAASAASGKATAGCRLRFQ
jgi:hypothetical protein